MRERAFTEMNRCIVLRLFSLADLTPLQVRGRPNLYLALPPCACRSLMGRTSAATSQGGDVAGKSGKLWHSCILFDVIGYASIGWETYLHHVWILSIER